MNLALTCLQTIGIDVWVPTKIDDTAQLASKADHAPERIVSYQVIYQAQLPTNCLVVCDQAALAQWSQVRKLLANILCFLGFKPGHYHIIAPCEQNADTLGLPSLITRYNIKKIVSFGATLPIDYDSNLFYTETSSLTSIITKPETKRQVMHDLLKNGF